MSDNELGGARGEIGRREALKRGAMLGSAAFVIPVVSSISMSRAVAQTPSGGGTGGGGDTGGDS
jgi:hypothetical protein